MDSVSAIKRLHCETNKGTYLYNADGLGTLLEESGQTLRSTIKRLVRTDILKHICRGCYMFTLLPLDRFDPLYDIAVFLRPGETVYESFESAVSRRGFTSPQVPADRITCFTSGSSSEISTALGTIEYAHLDQKVKDKKSAFRRDQQKIRIENMDKIDLPREMLVDIVERIVRAVDPVYIYVFGSYARGDYRKDSDIDLYVVVNRFNDTKIHTTAKLYKALFDLLISKDIIVEGKADFENPNNIWGVAVPVKKEGVLIYG